MRLILRLRMPGKARLGSELESGTGRFSLRIILIHVNLEKDLYNYMTYVPYDIGRAQMLLLSH